MGLVFPIIKQLFLRIYISNRFDFRLESYDRNFNFGYIQCCEDKASFQMTTPEPTDSKDINTDSKVCILKGTWK